ncbi:hypothetical protein E2542_SST27140 [Spatholobus suberectus]|nr:hypothetical protein E2542_SST27140 [Spatholobus suberectus]
MMRWLTAARMLRRGGEEGPNGGSSRGRSTPDSPNNLSDHCLLSLESELSRLTQFCSVPASYFCKRWKLFGFRRDLFAGSTKIEVGFRVRMVKWKREKETGSLCRKWGNGTWIQGMRSTSRVMMVSVDRVVGVGEIAKEEGAKGDGGGERKKKLKCCS